MSFPGESPPFIPSVEVIGIARDVRSMDLRKLDESYLYIPLSQSRQWTSTLLVRAEGNLSSQLTAVGHEVHLVDANLPVIAAPLDAMVSTDPYFVVSRIGGVLASIVGALGLLLACLGVYGLVAYSAVQRTREIGIRVALGAKRSQILNLILRGGMRPVLAGLIIGFVTAAVISRVLSTVLFARRRPARSMFSFAGVSFLLLRRRTARLLAAARRATRWRPYDCFASRVKFSPSR